MIENGWKITLSTDDDNTNNVHYLCRCEQHTSVLINNIQDKSPLYICENCGNDLFLSYDTFKDISKHLYYDDFNHSTSSYLDHNGWHIVISYTLPFYDNKTDKLDYKSIDVLHTTLSHGGDISVDILEKHIEQKVILQNIVASKLVLPLRKHAAESLVIYFFNNLPSHLQWLSSVLKTNTNGDQGLRLISYCLKNPSVKEIDLFYWNDQYLDEINSFSTSKEALTFLLNNKREKSVQKALFLHYKEKMQQDPKFYDPTFDYVILRVFNDPNYLTFLLSLPAYYKNNMFVGDEPNLALNAFNFFLEYYSEKLLFSLIKQSLKVQNTYNLWRDSIRMLSRERTLPIFKEHFERQKPKVALLHDELVRVQNQYIIASKVDMLKMFDYAIPQIKAETIYEDMDFRLPSTAKELHSWGKELNNCMFSYVSAIENRSTTIYGVYKLNKLTYAVEVQGNKLVQAKATNNSRVSEQEQLILKNWHKDTLNDKH